LDWVGLATSAAVAYDLEGIADLYTQTINSLSNVYAIHASRILQGYYVERNGQLEIKAALEDVASKKTIDQFQVAGPIKGGVTPLANELAKRLNARARPFGTSNPVAFRAYGEALGASDRADALKDLEAATQADPNFGAAYIAWKRLLATLPATGAGDASPVAARAARLGPIERAKFDDNLDALAKFTPADASVFQRRAQLRLRQRKIASAVQDFEMAARLDPDEPENWNQLGYALAYARDLAGARQALETYQHLLAPENANALDSLGEVSFYLGDFAGAANYFLQAQAKNPGQFRGVELLKAAQARLMLGDLAGADALFQKYIGSPPDSVSGPAALEQAQWEFLTGRRKGAIARLEKLIPQLDSDRQSLAYSQLSIWKLLTGDAQSAAALAAMAAERAVTPGARNLSAICRAVTSIPAAGVGNPLVQAYALLLAKKFPEAKPVLSGLYLETNPVNDGPIRTLLAWDYFELGQIADLEPLLANDPLPISTGESVFACLTFPRYVFLKGVALEKEGKRDQAKRSYELFLKYAGDVPEVFGDVSQARQRISHL